MSASAPKPPEPAGRAPALEGGGVLTEVLRTAPADALGLALGVAAICAAVYVGGDLLLGHASNLQRAADLEKRLRGAGDIEKQLATLEDRLALEGAAVKACVARIPPDLRPQAIDVRIEFKAKELGLQLTSSPTDGFLAPLPLGDKERSEVRRFDRVLDARGDLKQVLELLAAIESWDELVAVRALNVKRGGKGSEVFAHIEIAMYQLVPGEEGGRP